MTNTTTAIRFTARCFYCAQSFKVDPGQLFPVTGKADLVCDDNQGRLCCDDCLCAYCGCGHVTQTDADLCAGDATYPSGNHLADFCYDAWADALGHPLTVG
ncbi:MAG: hypothetical protein HOY78_02295 [Saccharothrix sp.]|nr:hypothetical protein [Saccharothrix sp.]